MRLRTFFFGAYVGRHGRRRPLFPGTYEGHHRPAPSPPIPAATVRVDLPPPIATRRVALGASDQFLAVAMGFGLLAAVWLTQRPLSRWTSSNPGLNLYVIQPIIWTTFAVVAWRLYRRLSDAPPHSRILLRIAFLAGLFHISVFMVSGLVFGFGDNSSTGVLADYPKNALYFTTLVIGVEAARAYVFHAWRQINEMAAFVITVVIFAAVATPLGQWQAISDLDTLFRIGVGRYLPALTLSAVATSFVAGGGIFVSAAYLWPVFGVQWLLPILPAHDWPVRALIGIALPLTALIVARTLYEGTAEFAERYLEEPADDALPEQGRSWFGWITTVAVAVLIVLFVNGTFGVEPYLLSGISMEPTFERGDVVIVREVPIESLEVNDVIRYQQSSFEFVHRIIEILEDEGEPIFLTKGDNVDRPDPLVTADRITGRVVFVLPKIGLPSLWIRETLDNR
jgi:signal peptidase